MSRKGYYATAFTLNATVIVRLTGQQSESVDRSSGRRVLVERTSEGERKLELRHRSKYPTGKQKAVTAGQVSPRGAPCGPC